MERLKEKEGTRKTLRRLTWNLGAQRNHLLGRKKHEHKALRSKKLPVSQRQGGPIPFY